jgi:transcriptional regulator with XRE-family HTH domain
VFYFKLSLCNQSPMTLLNGKKVRIDSSSLRLLIFTLPLEDKSGENGKSKGFMAKRKKISRDPSIRSLFRLVNRHLDSIHALKSRQLSALESELEVLLKWSVFRKGDYLQGIRLKLRLTQDAVSKMTGISISAIGNYEAGWKVIPIVDAEKIYGEFHRLGSVEAALALNELNAVTACAVSKVREMSREVIAAQQIAETNAELALRQIAQAQNELVEEILKNGAPGESTLYVHVRDGITVLRRDESNAAKVIKEVQKDAASESGVIH